jgi:leucyl/phenylalanyl-tRNA--protein transferase
MDADDLLDCYRRGVFPMAESAGASGVYIVDPHERAVLPLDRFHVPRRLARTVRRDPYRITADRAFHRVMQLCAEPAPDRRETWINADILALYGELHRRGHAHSIECWSDEALVGGLYGVALGAAFFGESMFSRATDASKIALVHLVARLRAGRYRLLDAQFYTPHLAQFGIEIMSRRAFRSQLRLAVSMPADFHALPSDLSGAQLLQSIAHTS